MEVLPFLLLHLLVGCVLTVDQQDEGNIGEEHTFKLSKGDGRQQITFPVQEKDLKKLLESIQGDTKAINASFYEIDDPGLSVTINPILLRVSVEVSNAKASFPVKVILQQGRTSKSFQLPYTRAIDRNKTFISNSFPSRTIDLCPLEPVTRSSSLSVTLLPTAEEVAEVKMRVELVSTHQGWLSKEEGTYYKEERVTKSSPVVVSSDFTKANRDAGGSVLVTVESLPGSDCFCTIVSIQQPSCPFFDSPSTSIRFGIWHTMLNKSAAVINTQEFPNGFLVVVVATESNDFCDIGSREKYSGCFEDKTGQQIMKNLKITVSANGSTGNTLMAIFVMLTIYIVTIAICFGLASKHFRYKFEHFKGMEVFWKQKKKRIGDVLPGGMEIIKKISILSPSPAPNAETASDQVDQKTVDIVDGTVREEEDLAVDEADICVADFRKCRTKVNLRVSDLSMKLDQVDRTKSIYQKSNLYLGNFMLVSIFYSIAVLQLAFQSAAKQSKSGSQDICFFNNLCQNPLGFFLDFNHFYSNFGYVVSGLAFVGIVHLKKTRFENMKATENFVDNKYGIPHQYGIYYTMGGALMMEGLLSASYHVCPSQVAFQFDTTYMYLIAILIYTKLYQNRHTDVTSNSIQTYFLLGMVLILEAISIYYSTPAFWSIFCIVYILTLVMLVLNIYNIGAVRNDRFLIVHVAKMFFLETMKLKTKFQGQEKVSIRPNLIFLILKCVLNISLCIYYAYKASTGAEGASNYFLLMFMVNMAAYAGFYVTMKLMSGERLTPTTCLYGIFSALFALPSLYFFLNKASKSELSPAESRDLNNGCQMLGYFDQHDIWHFMGGVGLFFCFLFIFTIDEDLKYTKRSEIRVF